MVYQDRENSAVDGSPIEGFKFVGSFKTYLYTSSDREQVINGETYTPIAIQREEIPSGTQEESQLELRVRLPRDVDLVNDYAYAPGPPVLSLEILRYHQGDDSAVEYVTAWKGPVTGFSITGNTASLIVPSIFSVLLTGTIPTVSYQTVCNHRLYDDRCQVSRASFSETSTVQQVQGTEITVASSSFADGVLVGGELVNTTTNERRLIIANVGSAITVNLTFAGLSVGDTVEFVAGCDHSFDTCRDKFNNTLHFGGHPYIPSINPFEVNEL